MVKKIDPEESLGVICKSNDQIKGNSIFSSFLIFMFTIKFLILKVVEYSEISEENRKLRNENKDLVYNAGNICNHFFKIDFLNEVCR